MSADIPPSSDPLSEVSDASGDSGTVTWRELLAETEVRLAAANIDDSIISARRIIEEASGHEGADFHRGLDELATVRGVSQLDAMVERRSTGEPLQYVLGRWSFRSLDLMVDRRVLIPRPETEEVVGWALEALRQARRQGPATVVDLGTGSGAIGLSFLIEAEDVDVWLTDRSADALAVARANLVGLSRAASRGRVVHGSWFEALPVDLEGSVDLIVSNPPYIAEATPLPANVIDWEPTDALIAGPAGDEALHELREGAQRWLAPNGALVIELSPEQADETAELIASAFSSVEVRSDLSGRQRGIVAIGPKPPAV